MHIVEIRRDGESLAASMSRMRDWVDARGIEPIFFGFDESVFRLGFKTADQANALARAFNGRFGGDRDRLAA